MSKNNTPYIDWFRKEYVGENGYVDCHGEVLLDDITKTIEGEREKYLKGFIIKMFGKRCKEYEAFCPVCEMWELCDEYINKLKKVKAEIYFMPTHKPKKK